MASVLVNVPAAARRGEIVQIKTLISHAMEPGYRRDSLGATVPRDILRRFVCAYNGEEVFRADLYPAVAANPYFAFSTIATESGTLEFTWSGDNGFSASGSALIKVEG
jgi:sulfur-oxidizing protein SoxZ